jgi:hypothetical protein
MKNIKLDKYYTKKEIALDCITKVPFLSSYEIIMEPSAGDGSFSSQLPNCIAYDIEPENDTIIKQDFFMVRADISKKILVIGNPPFGKKSELAIAFFNHAAFFATTIAFIVPLQFRKWSVQKDIDFRFKLILDIDIPKNSFLIDNKEVDVNCCFQIWTIEKGITNLRIVEKPTTKHPDFKIWQYNYTKEALKYFNKEHYHWDFAVPRQGYYDYTLKVFREEDLDPKIQWVFFKASSELILNRLLALDFVKLSLLNTRTPGFGKYDIIQEYNYQYPRSY